MWLESEAFHKLEVLAAVYAGGGEHVVRDGGICATLECALAVVAENAATARKTDERLRVDESVNRHDAAEFVVRELREIFVRRSGNRVQHVHRSGLDAELAQIQAHVDAVFHRFAKAHDAAAANFEASRKSVLECANLIVVSMRRANIREVTAVRFQVVVEAGEACFLELVELFPVQEACRKANRKLRLFFQAAERFANLFHVAVRKRTARSHDGVTRDACRFFLLGVGDNLVGAEQLVFGGAGVVVAALGAVLAVFGAAAAAGVHDGTKIKVVAVEFFADFVSGFREFVEVFA